MQKISDVTIEQLRAISPDELVAHGVIDTAPNHKGNRGYCCPSPLCGSGNGRNHSNGVGDGAGAFDDRNRFYCHACGNADNGGHKLSPIDLFAISRNIQNENFGEKCRQMCREFGLPVDFEEKDLPRSSRRRNSTKFKSEIKPTVDTKEKELIHADLRASDDELKNFMHYQPENKWRGLPLDILQKHGVKFNPKWTSPKSRLEKKFSTPTPRMLIPSGDCGYLARLTCNLNDFDERTQKYIREKEHAGTKILFNADLLNADEPIFAVEGYIDALSCELAGFKAVALGGRNRGNLLVDAVAMKEKKPQIIILLDADKSGRETAPELFDALIDVGCPCVVRFITADESKLDCNQILQEQGLDALQDRLQSIVDDSLAELDAVTRELEKEKDSRLSVDLLNFLFDGDASDRAFAKRLEKFCGDRVKWCDQIKRWYTFDNGVWTRGGSENSAVSNFANDLAELMLQNAASEAEQKLADKFQSAKKLGSSLNLFKAQKSVRITLDDLDRHGELLNALNGVVDLQTGKFYDATPELLLTRQCRADYQASARSELIEKFLADIMPDEMTRAGLLRWLAYNLTNETREHKFAIWTGERGANGKSTLSDVMLELLGTYGTGLATNALLKSNRPVDADRATTSLNPLENRRAAFVDELPLNAVIDSALIKNLSGGGKINLRLNFGEFRTVPNIAKINISGNFAPRIENVNDGGIRRRMINFAFNVQFGTKEHPADPLLKEKLILPENLRGLLAVLVREAVAYYKGDGLIISPLMKNETQRHLDESNFVADFISDFYVKVPTAEVKAKDFIDELKAEYPRECAQFNKRADLIKLISSIDGVAYGEGSTGHVRVFRGIGKAAPSSM